MISRINCRDVAMLHEGCGNLRLSVDTPLPPTYNAGG